MPQSYSCLYTHLVFATKRRAPLISSSIQARLYAYMRAIIQDCKCHPLAVGGMPDHIHILTSLSREISTSTLLREIKAHSSGWIHRTFSSLPHFNWQDGYGAFSISHSDIEKVRTYIKNQTKHHSRMSFAEEFESLLSEQSIEYEPRYLWKD